MTNGKPATGVNYPEKFNTIAECAAKCREVSDCHLFHYYGEGDEFYKDCYLDKSGRLSYWPRYDRNIFAGICHKGYIHIFFN